MAKRSREQFAAVSDIGEIPPVADPERRERCRLDLELFLTTYFPASTGLKPFSGDHRRAINRIQGCALNGGLFVNAFPRGFAKTTIGENASVWAVLYGHRRFVPVFGADASSAAGNIDSIKLELSENDLLYADFPEVCHAIRALEGKPQRCGSQTHAGTLTHIEWTADTIVLPTIKDSAASGAVITAHGLTGASRGMKHKRPDGTQQRPDFVIIDDPQTDESARSDVQVTNRLDVIRKSILKLGGHNRRIACVINATVIRKGDLVEQLANPKKFPAWQAERIKMVRKWADVHESLWLGDYQRLRNTYDAKVLGDQQRAHHAATEFYKKNRAKMDAGCEVAWEHCLDPGAEISAIQHAYNCLIDDGPEVFASECQNEPLEEMSGDAEDLMLGSDAIAEKVNGRARGVLVAEATRLVGFIDVQKNVLFWMVAAFADDFTGSIVDYGVFPDQRRSYFAANDSRLISLKKHLKTNSLEETIYGGLDRLVGNLMEREWKREDGATLRPERLMIDANWGDSSDVVYQFCRESPHAAVLLPSHGRGIGVRGRRFAEYRKQVGDRIGLNWRMPNVRGKRSVRYLIFDSNWWKTFLHSRLKTPAGGRGSLTLFAGAAMDHKLVADHLAAEKPAIVESEGRSIVEWKLPPNRPDNHWLDCAVGCCVAASERGAALRETEAKKIAVKKIKLSELQKQKQQARYG